MRRGGGATGAAQAGHEANRVPHADGREEVMTGMAHVRVRPGGVSGQIGGIAAAGVLAAGGRLAAAGPAAAQPAVLYAAVTATGAGDCSTVADACTLSTALGQVDP